MKFNSPFAVTMEFCEIEYFHSDTLLRASANTVSPMVTVSMLVTYFIPSIWVAVCVALALRTIIKDEKITTAKRIIARRFLSFLSL